MARMIDADGHIVEPRVLWEEYVEPEFRDRVIQIRPDREGREIFYVNGEARNPLGGSIVMSVIPGGFLDLERARNATYDDVLPGSYDPEERIRVMDVEGIELAVLLTSQMRESRRRRAARTTTGWRTFAGRIRRVSLASRQCHCKMSAKRFARCAAL